MEHVWILWVNLVEHREIVEPSQLDVSKVI